MIRRLPRSGEIERYARDDVSMVDVPVDELSAGVGVDRLPQPELYNDALLRAYVSIHVKLIPW